MGIKWVSTTLSEVALSINTGLDAIRRAPIVAYETQLRCLRIQDISQNKPIEKWGFTETTDNDHKKYRLIKNDIIMARTCSTGISYLVLQDMPAVFNNGLARIRLDTQRIIPSFMYYIFQSRDFAAYINGISGGTSVQLNMKIGDLANYKFKLPPLKIQKEISDILSLIDNKITLNRQINQTLEHMAQALFKSWFVDFDPVVDNALDAGFFEQNSALPEELLRRAEQRKIVREQSDFKPLPAETRQLFPAEFEECEEPSLGLGGWMPKGWGNGVLSDLLILQRGFDLPKSKRTDGSIPLMAASGQDGTHNESKVRGPGVVTGRSGKLGVVNLVIEDFWPLNTTLWIKEYPRSNPYHAYFLLQTIPLEQFNSGSAVPTLNRNHVHNKPVTLPSQDLLNKYADLVKDNFTQIQNRSIQSKTLEKLRDTLLPKLISGELRLNDDGTLASGNTDC